MRRSKEEKFIAKLYEIAAKRKDLEISIDRYKIGDLFGEHKRTVDTIVQTLTKTNFIKKDEGSRIYLTPQGIKLAESLLGG